MPLRLGMTGKSLAVTGRPRASVLLAPLPPDTLLVTEAGDLLLSDEGQAIAVESSHGG